MAAQQPSQPTHAKLPLPPLESSGGHGDKEDDADDNVSRAMLARDRKPRKLTRIACQGCQRSKAKCDGAQPTCGRCNMRKKECIYESEDRRNKSSLRESLDEALERVADLTHLVSRITLSNESEVLSIWRQLQNGANAKDISRSTRRGRDTASWRIDDDSNSPPSGQGLTRMDNETSLELSRVPTKIFSGRDGSMSSRMSLDSAVTLETLLSKALLPETTFAFYGKISELGLDQPQLRIRGNMDPALQMSFPMYLMQPKHVADSGAFSQTIILFRDHIRKELNAGKPEEMFLGIPGEVCINSFMDRTLPLKAEPDCDQWACQVAMSFDSMGPNQVLGSIVLLANFMKWCIRPSEPRYLAIGKILQPSLAQLLVPHRPDIDVCLPAVIRDALIARWRDYLPAITKSLRLSWTAKVSETVVWDESRRMWLARQEFQDFAKHPENWTFLEEFLELFPEGRGHITIRPDDLELPDDFRNLQEANARN